MKTPKLPTCSPRFPILILCACLAGAAVAADKEAATKSGAAGAAVPAVTKAEGTWKWNFTMPDGTKVSPRAKLKREGNVLNGTSSIGAGSEIAITDGRVDGDQMSWKVIREHAGQKVSTRYSAKISGESAKGTIESDWAGEVQVYPWEPRRASDSPTGTWRWEMSFGRGGGGGGGGRGGGQGGGARQGGTGGGGGGRGGGFGFEVRAALKLEGEKLSGKVSTTFTRTTETEITNASFKDGNISFETERERSDGTISVTKYSGKMDGDTIKGRMEFEFREELQKATWEATRVEE